MAAWSVDVFLVALILYAGFEVKKTCFVSSDTIGLSIVGEEMDIMEENYILSSLWSGNMGKRNVFRFRISKTNLCCILLLLCGDIHPCPGPQLKTSAHF
jgi:hypothetical protein